MVRLRGEHMGSRNHDGAGGGASMRHTQPGLRWQPQRPVSLAWEKDQIG